MVWSPLASGLLSGKFRPSRDGAFGEGRLQSLMGSNSRTPRGTRVLSETERQDETTVAAQAARVSTPSERSASQ